MASSKSAIACGVACCASRTGRHHACAARHTPACSEGGEGGTKGHARAVRGGDGDGDGDDVSVSVRDGTQADGDVSGGDEVEVEGARREVEAQKPGCCCCCCCGCGEEFGVQSEGFGVQNVFSAVVPRAGVFACFPRAAEQLARESVQRAQECEH
eukprot:427073-Pleurochrysis_carterae.AAC.1